MHEGHRDRLRQRFLEDGLDSFQPHQVLELLLFYAIPRKDTNQIAHSLIQKYGSLAGVLEADPGDLERSPGIGRNGAALISLIPSIFRAYFKSKWGDKPIINSTAKAGEYVISLFAGKIYEAFYAICLDNRNRINYASLIYEGTIDQAIIYPRTVVQTVLRYQANSVILAHNHPGGSLIPSCADIDATDKIVMALETISINVVDHFIVAGDKYLSFAEHGLIKNFSK